MKENDVSSRIVKYILEHYISIEQITKATNIPPNKLKKGGQKLNAAEFLELCFFLNVRPEEFYDNKM